MSYGTRSGLDAKHARALGKVAEAGDDGLPAGELAPSVLTRLLRHPHGPLVEFAASRLVVTEAGRRFLPSPQPAPHR